MLSIFQNIINSLGQKQKASNTKQTNFQSFKQYNVIGVMSGSSLDGLDIAYCQINLNKQEDQVKYDYQVISGKTIEYPSEITKKFQDCVNYSPLEFLQFDREYGKFIGLQVSKFMENHEIYDQIDFVCSHGHTIFHEPETKQLTVQIGHVSYIAQEAKKTTIGDFRSMDVALGGQGAPLVPIGDQLLFQDYDFCMNFGGISNISFYSTDNTRIAFDISPCNILCNYLAEKLGHEYDKNGDIARNSEVNQDLLKKLQNQEFMLKNPPKSLDRQYIEQNFIKKILDQPEYNNIKIEDKLATVTYFISNSISETIQKQVNESQIKKQDSYKVLATGGGALNKFCMESLQENLKKCNVELCVPDQNLVDFKEALIFAFLGVLNMEQQCNTLQSVTGACQDSIGGVIQYFK